MFDFKNHIGPDSSNLMVPANKQPDGHRTDYSRAEPLWLSARAAIERFKAVSPWANDPLPPEQDASEWEGIEVPASVDTTALADAWTAKSDPEPNNEGSNNIAEFMVALWVNGALMGFMADINGRRVHVDPRALGKRAVFDRLVTGLPVTLPTEADADSDAVFMHHGFPAIRTGAVEFLAKDVWAAWNEIEADAPEETTQRNKGGQGKAHERLTGIGMRLLQNWSGTIKQKWMDAAVAEYGCKIDTCTVTDYLTPIWKGWEADREHQAKAQSPALRVVSQQDA